MSSIADRMIAIVGVGAIMPDAPTAASFWKNILAKRYSIGEVPPERWSVADYYDPDPSVPDKTYSKIGGWVRGFSFDWQRFRIPPRVAAAMDEGQQWAVSTAAETLADYGYPDRPLDLENTGVILGTAMGGELHYRTNLRVSFPEYAHALESTTEFQNLPAATRAALLQSWHERLTQFLPQITEDSMPGELPNIVAGRVANVLNFRGPSFITDAACASTFAAIAAAVEMLSEHHCDAVLTGGVDRNMGASTFIKFCKIGALSATGTRPFGDGADGFVMGEGTAMFLLKRLSDAERHGDRIYAVIRGVGASSDGKGKGITAPNPVGQVLAITRAWQNAGLDPISASLVEAHGTSTKVGDVVEVESLTKVFGAAARGQIGFGSAKSNIGHLKAGAGAAGLLKTVMALHEKVLPPTLNAQRTNPNINFAATPFALIHEAREWERPAQGPRRAGVSAYGFGGTNYHVVVEEHVPGALTSDRTLYRGATSDSSAQSSLSTQDRPPAGSDRRAGVKPVRGILALGAATPVALKDALDATFTRVQGGWTPPLALPAPTDLRAAERLVIDFGNHDELLERIVKARKAMGFDNPAAWKALQAQGVFRGSGPRPGKIAFLFPGQGSQYINMGRTLRALSPSFAAVCDEADAVMTPILGRPLTSFIFVDADDPQVVKQSERDLMQTAITQPAMLMLDAALARLLSDYGFTPDVVMGHSLGEYAALTAAGIMPFADALEAAAARGSEMTKVSVADNGWMAAVMAPLDVIQQTLAEIEGYLVIANVNSYHQAVIGGASTAVERAIEVFKGKGFDAQRIPVSHAFHTQIVAPASGPLRQVLNRLRITPPRLPLVANVTGMAYPTDVEGIKDILEQQIASPVQWVKGLETLYADGVRAFVEVGPKKALKGFVDDVLGEKVGVLSLFTNHPKVGELPSFNQALCGLYAAGYVDMSEEVVAPTVRTAQDAHGVFAASSTPAPMVRAAIPVPPPIRQAQGEDRMMANGQDAARVSTEALGQVLAQAIQQLAASQSNAPGLSPGRAVFDRNAVPTGSVVISGTGLGLPGAEKQVMDPENALRILRGEQFIDLIPDRFRKQMLAKRITRLVKSADGSGHFETITDPNEVIKLAGRPGAFDMSAEYGVPEKLVEALDITTQLAMAAGLDALREAGIPLVQHYRKTTTGKYLPDRWMLPEGLREETGIIFASAFPGYDRLIDEFDRYYGWQNRLDQLTALMDLRRYAHDAEMVSELSRRISALRAEMERSPYEFDRRFLFRVLAMGHSQFAEYIGARGPNTQVNAACASTTQAIGIAEDWIRSGRCRRVLVIAADDVTSDRMMEWIGAGFLATGAAATDDRVEEAALPFDRRRHGMITGMGACALVVESEDAVRERGMRGIVELLSSEFGNSAFHGTRLDVTHISQVMDRLVGSAERRFGLDRRAITPQLVFVSHETYTPARGGSAAAEVIALRHTFGEAAGEIVMANTKGFTGHPMGVGIEDAIAVKILEHGVVPPVPNFKEVDPDLGALTLSRGGRYPVQYAIHLAAGFGSQIAMTLTHRIPGGPDRVDSQPRYQRWLADVSGYDQAETEVVKRVLRVKAQGAPTRIPTPSPWVCGTGPTVRVSASGEAAALYRPAPDRSPAADDEFSPAPTPIAVRTDEQRATPSTPAIESRPAPATTPAPAPTPPPAPVSIATSASLVVNEHPSAPASDPVAATVMQIIAEKTGYPSEMLELDLDLEADLGIDTVKQAETFAAVRAAFDIPRKEQLRLRDFPTLGSVVGFVHDNRPDLAVSTPAAHVPSSTPGQEAPAITPQSDAPTAEQQPELSAGEDPVAEKVLTIIAEKTGYPQEMLDLDLDLEADLGVDTVKQAETFAAVRAAFDIPRRDDLKLRDYPTLASVIGFVHTNRPDLALPMPTPHTSVPSPSNADVPVSQTAEVRTSTLPPASQPTDSASSDPVAEKVLAIIADKTGYPPEMLELDADLEADLGVDTVKQAETFAAVRAAFDIPRRDDLKLRDYPTLASVIGFVHTNRPDLAQSSTNGTPDTPQGAAAETPTPPSNADPVTEKVLAIIAEKTGYPPEMLELDADLEADLGVDTVKQAETFAAVRAAFGIPRRDDLKLRDYPTLASVIGFVHTNRPDLTQPATNQQPASNQPATSQQPTHTTSTTTSPAHIRRIPTPSLRPALDLCKPTGVTLDQQSNVLVMMDRGGVGKALVNRLEKRGVRTLVIEEPLDSAAIEERVRSELAAGAIQGVYWLPALDIEPALEELDLETWRELNRQRVKNLYLTMRLLYESISTAGSFLVVATRLGGLHGYGPAGASAPLGGAVTGFAKAYKRERGAVLVKAVDFEIGRKTAEPADLLIAETLADPGVVEIGYAEGLRFGITVIERPLLPPDEQSPTLGKETVFLVTGAAGGITSAIVGDLAQASSGIFYLLDLVAEPRADDPHIALFRNDKEALKRALIDELKASGERPTPVMVDRRILAIERSEAALRAIETVRAAGGTPHYASVDLLNGPAVAAVMNDVRTRYGRIDVLLHAGGLEISKSLADKEPREFDLVFDVKADGFFNLLRAARGLPIGATVAFSSVAGRFGNSGQTDYSAANDLLCKLTSSMRTWRPTTRTLVIDWTAWGGIGMATRGSIPKIMELAGIDMLPPEIGIPTIRHELTAGGGTRAGSGEIVVGDRLGILTGEFDPTGGLDVAKVTQLLAAREQPFLMLGTIVAAKLYGGLDVETTLDPRVQPFLYDHQIDGTPVLPGVMGTEAFAELTNLLAPGYHIAAIEEQFRAPFKFYRNQPRTLYLSATISPATDGTLVATATLRSITPAPRPELPARTELHFSAQVRLTTARPIAPTAALPPAPHSALPVEKARIYQIYFHGPAYQVLDKALLDGDQAIGIMAHELPPNSAPAHAASLIEPRLIELCFQTAGIWEVASKGVMALPLAVESVTTYQHNASAGIQRYALVKAHNDGETFDARVLDEAGNVYIELRGYRTIQLPGTVTI